MADSITKRASLWPRRGPAARPWSPLDAAHTVIAGFLVVASILVANPAAGDEQHSALPTRAPVAPSRLAADARVDATALDGPARRVAAALACACFESGALQIDATRSLADASCSCAYASRVRADVAEVVAGAAAAERQDAAAMALRVETELLSRSPDYERLLRYDAAQYRYFLENVRCLCEGCKATVYFSNCQLTCAPGIVYKRRARVFLALGISVDGLIDFYLAEHNASHPPAERVAREFLLPRRQKQRGWGVPAALIGGAALSLGLALSAVVRRRRGLGASGAAGGAMGAESALTAAAPPAMTAAERAELEEALEGLGAGSSSEGERDEDGAGDDDAGAGDAGERPGKGRS